MQNNDGLEPRRPAHRQAQQPAVRRNAPGATPRSPGARAPAGARSPVGRPSQPRRRPTTERRPTREGGNRWFQATVMVLATLALCIFLAAFVLRSASDLFGLNQEDKIINVVVPEGSTHYEISNILARTGVVDQPLTFRLYSGLKSEEGDFQPGEYNFNSNMGYDQIIQALLEGDTTIQEVTITFIEGLTLYEIAKMLEEKEVCDAEEFMEYLQTGALNDYSFVDRMPGNAHRFRRMEGYIFPDTYDFYVNEKVSSVAGKFLDNFESKITESMETQMRSLNLTLDETVILASIIQKEAGERDQMRRVSAVFHNRLNRSDIYPNLQSDVTIHYVESFIKPFLDYTNQEMYDAYNTYVGEGLPPGAICSPGLDAIEAALDPANTNNYFFVTDSFGTYYYAETAEQHYINVREAEAVGGKDIHGTDTQD